MDIKITVGNDEVRKVVEEHVVKTLELDLTRYSIDTESYCVDIRINVTEKQNKKGEQDDK